MLRSDAEVICVARIRQRACRGGQGGGADKARRRREVARQADHAGAGAEQTQVEVANLQRLARVGRKVQVVAQIGLDDDVRQWFGGNKNSRVPRTRVPRHFIERALG